MVAYFDYILITGGTEKDYLKNPKKGLAHMQLKVKKCLFQQEKVEYLGHSITKDGIFPTMAKVRTIKEAPVPKNKQSY